MIGFYDICGTHIPLSAIKDFRIIDVEFIYRPIFRKAKKSVLSSFTSNSNYKKRFEFVSMQPFAAIIGQQGHKSALGEYRPKDFKEALGKDISGAVIYTIADKLKLKAFKQQKYQCLNLAGRAFTTFLDDVPAMIEWNDGRIAEVYKEDPLYNVLGEITTPGIQYISALIIKADEVYCFYGNGIQLPDAKLEYESLTDVMNQFILEQHSQKQIGSKEKLTLPQAISKHLPSKSTKK